MIFNKGRGVEISFCIPVHNTEKYLGRCLDSVAAQDFMDCELVLINDCSTGKDEAGRNCKKIVREFEKKSKIPVVYIEHFSYVPLLETRRELVEQSHGKYILMIDSDDFLADGAVKALYESAVRTDADITCGKDKIYSVTDGKIIITEKNYAAHKEGLLSGREVFDSWLVDKTSSGFLWAKLIKRELYLKAFDSIPYMDCSFSVDTPMYFFLSYYAKSYYGISDVVYYYFENQGITANKKVTDLEIWRRQCTVSSNYSLLLTFDGDLSEEEKEAVRKMSRFFLRNAILRLRYYVAPELRDEAYQILCEYWGEKYVKTIEEIIDENETPESEN